MSFFFAIVVNDSLGSEAGKKAHDWGRESSEVGRGECGGLRMRSPSNATFYYLLVALQPDKLNLQQCLGQLLAELAVR